MRGHVQLDTKLHSGEPGVETVQGDDDDARVAACRTSLAGGSKPRGRG